MAYNLKPTGSKTAQSTNRTLYITLELKNRVERVAAEHNRSFNSTIVDMVEYCLNDLEKKKEGGQ